MTLFCSFFDFQKIVLFVYNIVPYIFLLPRFLQFFQLQTSFFVFCTVNSFDYAHSIYRFLCLNCSFELCPQTLESSCPICRENNIKYCFFFLVDFRSLPHFSTLFIRIIRIELASFFKDIGCNILVWKVFFHKKLLGQPIEKWLFFIQIKVLHLKRFLKFFETNALIPYKLFELNSYEGLLTINKCIWKRARKLLEDRRRYHWPNISHANFTSMFHFYNIYLRYKFGFTLQKKFFEQVDCDISTTKVFFQIFSNSIKILAVSIFRNSLFYVHI